MNRNIADYSFQGLRNGGRSEFVGFPSLCYLVSLTDSARHKISEPLTAKRILSWLFEVEGQCPSADDLNLRQQDFFSRYFVGGFCPQTPCMVVDQWSPISAMLELGMEPAVLNRESKFRAVASGIWQPLGINEENTIHTAATDVALFWAIIGKVTRLALQRKAWISIIAQPGWDRTSAINSLPNWPEEEVTKAGRVVWKRTPEG